MVLVVQLTLIGLWAGLFLVHFRRLCMLARINQLQRGSAFLFNMRTMLNRVWWQLGRPEFWADLQRDAARCIELTIMVMLLTWGAAA